MRGQQSVRPVAQRRTVQKTHSASKETNRSSENAQVLQCGKPPARCSHVHQCVCSAWQTHASVHCRSMQDARAAAATWRVARNRKCSLPDAMQIVCKVRNLTHEHPQLIDGELLRVPETQHRRKWYIMINPAGKYCSGSPATSSFSAPDRPCHIYNATMQIQHCRCHRCVSSY